MPIVIFYWAKWNQALSLFSEQAGRRAGNRAGISLAFLGSIPAFHILGLLPQSKDAPVSYIAELF